MWIGQNRQLIWTGRIKTQTKRNVSNFVGFKLRRTIVESTARTFLRSWYGNHTLQIASVKTAVIRIVNQMINDNMETWKIVWANSIKMIKRLHLLAKKTKKKNVCQFLSLGFVCVLMLPHKESSLWTFRAFHPSC